MFWKQLDCKQERIPTSLFNFSGKSTLVSYISVAFLQSASLHSTSCHLCRSSQQIRATARNPKTCWDMESSTSAVAKQSLSWQIESSTWGRPALQVRIRDWARNEKWFASRQTEGHSQDLDKLSSSFGASSYEEIVNLTQQRNWF